jgi:hypothetical protein
MRHVHMTNNFEGYDSLGADQQQHHLGVDGDSASTVRSLFEEYQCQMTDGSYDLSQLITVVGCGLVVVITLSALLAKVGGVGGLSGPVSQGDVIPLCPHTQNLGGSVEAVVTHLPSSLAEVSQASLAAAIEPMGGLASCYSPEVACLYFLQYLLAEVLKEASVNGSAMSGDCGAYTPLPVCSWVGAY